MPLPFSISGFSIVRNATVLEYPLEPAIRSILPLCDEVIINCGDSIDNTWERCCALEAAFPNKIKLFRSVWRREGQTGGFQLKSQTDSALNRCQGDWCIYIQADEVMHDADMPKLAAAMQRADKDPKIEGLFFDYVHFYGNFDYTIEGRNWYRREVRAFKNRRGITAYRDAQGFRQDETRLRVLSAETRIFHYGYVRNSESLKRKSKEMSQWWGEDPVTDEEQLRWVRHVGLKRFEGRHPAVMKEHISAMVTSFDPDACRRRWDKDEIKNLVSLYWEKLFHFRIGEYKNYEIIKSPR